MTNRHLKWCSKLLIIRVMQIKFTGVLWYLTVNLICITLIISNFEHHFRCLFVICMSSLEKCLFRILPIFNQVYLFVYILTRMAVCIFWILTHYRPYHLQILIFSPIQYILFLVADGFLYCEKVFGFNPVPFAYFFNIFIGV